MLCSYFNEALTNGDLVSEPQSNVKGREISVLLFGEELICSVEQASLTAKFKDKESESWRSSNIKSSLEFASCFVKLSCVKDETTVSTSLTTRLLLSLIHFVGCLHLEKDITLFIEIMTSTLLLWLSHHEAQDSNFKDQFQQLWIQTLNCLQTMQCDPYSNSIPLFFSSKSLFLRKLLITRIPSFPNLLLTSGILHMENRSS